MNCDRWLYRVSASALLIGMVGMMAEPLHAEPRLKVVYPPAGHETTSDRIFLVGTGDPVGEVRVNGQRINRSAAGHFAPSFPLQVGDNAFTLQQGSESLTLTVKRIAVTAEIPTTLGFAKNSLTPAVDIARLPNELVCFGAIAPPAATVRVQLAGQTIPLLPTAIADLPSNLAVLTDQNAPIAGRSSGRFHGCGIFNAPGTLGKPEFQATLQGQTLRETAAGTVTILPAIPASLAEVTADTGTARTGPSTDHSRLTPLPKGTRAIVTGSEGEWLRLDYGAWIKRSEVKITPTAAPVQSTIRSVTSRSAGEWTEIIFPLEVPIPVSVQQGEKTFTLTLHNTIAQSDTNRMDDTPLILRMDWQQSTLTQVQYIFHLKSAQQWGYKLRYEGSTLILALKNPPKSKSLTGMKILLDPGHGGPEDSGSRGPTGYPEKAVTLLMSNLVKAELEKRGAKVVMTRTEDVDLGLKERVDRIEKEQPAIALSIHYNALPDNGNAEKTAGVSMFWYHPQAHSLAMALHNSLVKKLNRPSAGVFWNNLALTRPSATPSILLELGFMINPQEFEWITNPEDQKKLAIALVDGIAEWVASR